MSDSLPLVDRARLRSLNSQDDARKIKPYLRGHHGTLFYLIFVIFHFFFFGLFSSLKNRI